MSFQVFFSDKRWGLERIPVSVANSEEEFRNTTVQELKRKLIPEDQLENTILRLIYRFNTLKKNRTLGFYGIKHEDHIIAERRGSTYTVTSGAFSYPAHGSTETYTYEDDDDEDKGLPRTQSMDIMIPMQQTDPSKF